MARSAVRNATNALGLLSLVIAAPLRAQEPDRFLLTGTVIDSETERPVWGVRVTLARSGQVLVTDEEGRFTLPPLSEGRYAMRLERPGYERVDGDLDVFTNGAFTVEMDPEPDRETGGRLQGLVLDAASGAPLPSVRIRLGERGPASETDAGGRFAFRGLEPGTYTVRLQALGYTERVEALEVRPGRIAHAELRLSRDPVEVEGLDVVVEERWLALDRSGFYRRRSGGLGIFVDRGEIGDRQAREITDVLLGRPGVHVVEVGSERGVVFEDGWRVGRGAEEWCGPTLWIDGVRMLQSEGGPTPLNRFVHPYEVVGIEVYRRPAEIPLQFGGLQPGCGALVVWTR